LFARGAADDKAGILVHALACRTLHCTNPSSLPNIRILIEGEEEVGSVGLAKLLESHREFLQSDVVIVADLGNFATGIPALTSSLRGMVALEIEVRSMERSVHSGIWSGPVHDSVQGLCKMIASLTDAQGNIAIPGLLDSVIPPDAQTLESYRSLGIHENEFRAQLGLKASVKLRIPESDIALAQWRQPSLTVTTIEAGNRKTAGNVLLDSAWARLSIRLVPGMEWKTVVAQVSDHLRKNCPWGLELTIQNDEGANAWVTPTSHPAFQQMLAALEAGYGTPARIIGCGASIPGAPMFTNAFGDIPVLLTGLEDALANAHGENESLDLEDFRKAICAEAEFLRILGSGPSTQCTLP
jgi:acetylornithine deacetylase/succinyl-diaminopimelate desuccinylase-like protein